MLPSIDCVGCGACANACPKSCLNMVADKCGFLQPEIQKVSCNNCGACERACPIINENKKETAPIQAYAAYSVNESIRLSSSSGGLFYTVAEYIIDNGGIVYGAAFDKNLYLRHIGIDSVEDLHLLQGSKYIQSDIGLCFKEVKEHLSANKLVLFCGTPCQVEGLLHFLQKPYGNLFTLDFICHGVPSPKVWQEYVKHQEERVSSKAHSAAFRDKTNGWLSFSSKLKFENEAEYLKVHYNDAYMKAFLQNISLRKSCYSCKFKSVNRNSDITMGDLWGIHKILPDLTDDKGVSVAFIQSEKGATLLQQIKNNLWLQEIPADTAVESNSAMVKSVYEHNFRDYFFKSVEKQCFEELINDCLSPSYYVRFKRKLYQIKSK